MIDRFYRAIMLWLMVIEILLLGLLVWHEFTASNVIQISTEPIACHFFRGSRCFRG